MVGGKNVFLTPKEYELLFYLIERVDKVVTRKELTDKLWPNSNINSRSLDMHIKSLRHKVFSFTNLEITTILKVGYKLTEVNVITI